MVEEGLDNREIAWIELDLMLRGSIPRYLSSSMSNSDDCHSGFKLYEVPPRYLVTLDYPLFVSFLSHLQ